MANTQLIYRPNLLCKNTPSRALLVKNPKLQKLFCLVGNLDYKIPLWDSIDDAVLYAVIGQMLSISAARSIINQLVKKFGSSRRVIDWAGKSSYRSGPVYGVSCRKRKALAEWNKYALNKNNFRAKWLKMPLDNYRAEISSIWGFGRWSADMMAIFYAGRKDIWPESDAGINKASRIIFGSARHSEIKKRIKGYETIISLYLWEMINRKIPAGSLRD